MGNEGNRRKTKWRRVFLKNIYKWSGENCRDIKRNTLYLFLSTTIKFHICTGSPYGFLEKKIGLTKHGCRLKQEKKANTVFQEGLYSI